MDVHNFREPTVDELVHVDLLQLPTNIHQLTAITYVRHLHSKAPERLGILLDVEEGKPTAPHCESYKIVSHLGGGAQGQVYRVEKLGSEGERLALKMMTDTDLLYSQLPTDADVTASRERKQQHQDNCYSATRELGVMHALQSADLVSVYSPCFVLARRGDGTPTLVPGILMREVAHCDAQDAIDMCIDGKRVTMARELAACALRALLDMHKAGVVHRDLKLTNMLVVLRAEKIVFKVVDLGSCCVIEDPKRDPASALHSTVAGTPGHQPLELIIPRAKDMLLLLDRAVDCADSTAKCSRDPQAVQYAKSFAADVAEFKQQLCSPDLDLKARLIKAADSAFVVCVILGAVFGGEEPWACLQQLPDGLGHTGRPRTLTSIKVAMKLLDMLEEYHGDIAEVLKHLFRDNPCAQDELLMRILVCLAHPLANKRMTVEELVAQDPGVRQLMATANGLDMPMSQWFKEPMPVVAAAAAHPAPHVPCKATPSMPLQPQPGEVQPSTATHQGQLQQQWLSPPVLLDATTAGAAQWCTNSSSISGGCAAPSSASGGGAAAAAAPVVVAPAATLQSPAAPAAVGCLGSGESTGERSWLQEISAFEGAVAAAITAVQETMESVITAAGPAAVAAASAAVIAALPAAEPAELRAAPTAVAAVMAAMTAAMAAVKPAEVVEAMLQQQEQLLVVPPPTAAAAAPAAGSGTAVVQQRGQLLTVMHPAEAAVSNDAAGVQQREQPPRRLPSAAAAAAAAADKQGASSALGVELTAVIVDSSAAAALGTGVAAAAADAGQQGAAAALGVELTAVGRDGSAAWLGLSVAAAAAGAGQQGAAAALGIELTALNRDSSAAPGFGSGAAAAGSLLPATNRPCSSYLVHPASASAAQGGPSAAATVPGAVPAAAANIPVPADGGLTKLHDMSLGDAAAGGVRDVPRVAPAAAPAAAASPSDNSHMPLPNQVFAAGLGDQMSSFSLEAVCVDGDNNTRSVGTLALPGAPHLQALCTPSVAIAAPSSSSNNSSSSAGLRARMPAAVPGAADQSIRAPAAALRVTAAVNSPVGAAAVAAAQPPPRAGGSKTRGRPMKDEPPAGFTEKIWAPIRPIKKRLLKEHKVELFGYKTTAYNEVMFSVRAKSGTLATGAKSINAMSSDERGMEINAFELVRILLIVAEPDGVSPRPLLEAAKELWEALCSLMASTPEADRELLLGLNITQEIRGEAATHGLEVPAALGS